MENHFNHIRGPPLNVTIFIMHVCNCVMGATPMGLSILPFKVSKLEFSELWCICVPESMF